MLCNISFTAKQGETVAFIGATGSGKTTLVSLIARFYDATSGQVLVDGQDVREYTFDALYDRIGYVTQKAILFSGDIRENVLFGESRAEASEDNVRQALDLAQATEFVEKLPGGIEAPIAEGGTNVPAGRSSGFLSPERWPESRKSWYLTTRFLRWTTGPTQSCGQVWRSG